MTTQPAHPTARKGRWMQTYTSRAVYPLDPRAEDVDILDIAHSLSMQCRYNGHCRRFYSVAEHCVLLSQVVSPTNALWALLHDATEAYVGDMVRPLKLDMPDFCAAEDAVMAAIAEKFGIDEQMPEEVHRADTAILLDERAALMGPPPLDWGITARPLGVRIHAWDPQQARREYLTRFRELTGHFRCDCVPHEGPAHCHGCSEDAGHPVPWSDATGPAVL